MVDTGRGPWVRRALDALAGCDPALVVVGARADEVIALLPAGVPAVRNDDFAQGMGSSLRSGLAALTARPDIADVEAVVVMLVDLPDVGAAVVRRLVAAGTGPTALARAVYAGRPGHPVLLGRAHWPGVLATASGDQGARAYLAARRVATVECGDLATGTDVDRPGAFDERTRPVGPLPEVSRRPERHGPGRTPKESSDVDPAGGLPDRSGSSTPRSPR